MLDVAMLLTWLSCMHTCCASMQRSPLQFSIASLDTSLKALPALFSLPLCSHRCHCNLFQQVFMQHNLGTVLL